ncbi:MAG: phosphoglycerate dehydrogenase [Pseudomonadota bacterium]
MSSLSLPKDRIRIALLEGIHPRAVEIFNESGYHNVQAVKSSRSGEALTELLADVHFLGIRSRTQLTAEVLAAAPRLNAVGCFCIGTNQVDLGAACELGIPVFNAPFSNTRSVAELVLAEMIMLVRGIPQRNAAAHRGEWAKSAENSFEVRGKTLAIIGYGHIGTQLGVLAEGLGMKVIFHDIVTKLPLGNAAAASSLHDALGAADVVSLHVPQTPQTENLMDAAAIDAMKPGSWLLNASRGNVVDIDSLAEALETGHVLGAAIDVFPTEPKGNDQPFESPLQKFDNVILTPHIGGSTAEAQINIAEEVSSKLVRYSDNGSTLSAVNFPEVTLPDHSGRHRIMHIHRNEPGVLRQVNKVFAEGHVNVAAQYLQTHNNVGYVVMDVETTDVKELLARLKSIEGTLRSRVLY